MSTELNNPSMPEKTHLASRSLFHSRPFSPTITAVCILIVKLGSSGDNSHTLPALAAIRQALPDAEILWVVEERSAEILRQNLLIVFPRQMYLTVRFGSLG